MKIFKYTLLISVSLAFCVPKSFANDTDSHTTSYLNTFKQGDVEGLKQKGVQGDVSAQLTLGKMYQMGIGVKANENTAMKWYKAAAEQGNNIAKIRLGKIYLYSSTPAWREPAKGLDLIKSAANQGDGPAQYELGIIYSSSMNISDQNQSKEWFVKAAKTFENLAKQGNSEAQYYLAEMYQGALIKEIPLDKDKNELVLELYTKSANQGNAESQLHLGNLYYDGTDDFPQDKVKGIKFYIQAAENGSSTAQYMLGNLYYDGKDVPQDKEKARNYYQQSCNNINRTAMDGCYGLQINK